MSNVPPMPGPADATAFEGPVHDARDWPAIDAAGRRVAIIVTAPAGMDVTWHVARRAASTIVFHRTPAHVIPDVPLLRLTGRVPALARPVAAAHRRLLVHDRELRRQLTPRRDRPVVSSNCWYPALRREGCRLMSWPITGITGHGVRTADGVEHLVDMLIVD